MMSIICVYNNENILNDFLLSSLEKQTEEYELILVDNRNQEYSSASSALNYGAKQSTGEYLIFAHQDIYFTDIDWIKKTRIQLDNLNKLGIAGVAGKIHDSAVYSNIKQGIEPVDVTPNKINKPEIASTLDECLFIIPRDIFKQYPLNEKICPDWHLYAVDYVLNIKEKGYEAYIIPTKLEHRSKGASMSEGYYKTLPNLQKKFFRHRLIRTCMGDWFTFIPVSIQRKIKKFKPY